MRAAGGAFVDFGEAIRAFLGRFRSWRRFAFETEFFADFGDLFDRDKDRERDDKKVDDGLEK